MISIRPVSKLNKEFSFANLIAVQAIPLVKPLGLRNPKFARRPSLNIKKTLQVSQQLLGTVPNFALATQ